MSKHSLTPAAALVGAALVGGLGIQGLAQAAGNPFAAQPLDTGYMTLAEAEGEGKCGSDKGQEGKCGEGKCGEGKCGGAT